MDIEQSLTKLDDYIGKKVQVVAYGASYVGVLQKVDYEPGFLILTDGSDTVTLDLDFVESFTCLGD